MKIIVTSGGTSEKIDDVRRVTNMSTGRLGNAIAQSFIDKHEAEIDRLYYLRGERAAEIDHPKVENVEIGGVMDLERELKRLLEQEDIYCVVHSMAVSDYRVDRVTTPEGMKSDSEEHNLSGRKISSDIEELVICMKRAPKVINMIKRISPDTKLVGFKLLSGVSHSELMEVAQGLMDKNSCDFVMANDLTEIGRGSHRGYLLHRDGDCDIMNTKAEIADTITTRLMWK